MARRIALGGLALCCGLVGCPQDAPKQPASSATSAVAAHGLANDRPATRPDRVADSGPRLSGETIRDLEEMPQDALAYLGKDADGPLADTATLAAFHESFRRNFFAVWDGKGRAPPVDFVRLRFEKYFAHPGYGQNFQPTTAEQLQALFDQAALDWFPNCGKKAITVRNTSLREMPTDRPIFALPPDQPADGYPFDLVQVSAVWVGTPLYVCQVSRDGSWLYVRAGFAAGWMKADDAAYVDDAFVRQWQRGALAAIMQDNVAISDVDGIHRVTAHVGTLLPLAQEPPKAGLTGPTTADATAPAPSTPAHPEEAFAVLLPVANEHRQAVAAHVWLSIEHVGPMPLPFTARNVAKLANQMLGEPYGWGGVYEMRDCSSTLRDLFLPFGLYLPRNSTAQGAFGKVVPLGGLSGPEKEKIILEQGRAFCSLVHIPGHIMLYIGPHEARAAVLHNFWGVHTFRNDRADRHVLGRCIITTLQPGIDLPDLMSGADRRERVDAMVLLDPIAEVVNEFD